MTMDKGKSLRHSGLCISSGSRVTAAQFYQEV